MNIKIDKFTEEILSRRGYRLCNVCGYVFDKEEFYMRTNGTHVCRCKACHNRIKTGVYKITAPIKRAFRYCPECKRILELDSFPDNPDIIDITSICALCSDKKESDSARRLNTIHKNAYVKNKIRTFYGIPNALITDELIDTVKQIILAKELIVYRLDNQTFRSMSEFGRYVESVYGVPFRTVHKRLRMGKTETECAAQVTKRMKRM